MKKRRKKFRAKYRRNGGRSLPGPPKSGRPPGVPWSVPSKRNPPFFTDLGDYVLPGFAGFAATKATSRIVGAIVTKRRPTWGPHAGALASVGAFAALWLLAHRVKQVAEYHTPVVVGSAIASLQTLVQTYLPKYGWLVGHPSEDAGAGALPAATAAGEYDQLLDGIGDDDDLYDGGGDVQQVPAQGNGRARQQRGAAPRQKGPIEEIDLDDLTSGVDVGDEDFGGIFSSN